MQKHSHVSDASHLASYAARWLRELPDNDDERVRIASKILERLSEDPLNFGDV
jgi:hypothetical protein